MKINVPDNVDIHNIQETGKDIAYTIPADGFDKLIGYKTEKISWVHKDYRIQSKKGKKR